MVRFGLVWSGLVWSSLVLSVGLCGLFVLWVIVVVVFVCFFPLRPLYYLRPISSSDPGSHGRLFSPLPTTVRALGGIFFARIPYPFSSLVDWHLNCWGGSFLVGRGRFWYGLVWSGWIRRTVVRFGLWVR